MRNSIVVILVGVLALLGACSSEPEQVVVGGGDEVVALPGASELPMEGVAPVVQGLPVPSMWRLSDPLEGITDASLAIFADPAGDGFVIQFSDGCVRAARETEEPGTYEVIADLGPEVACSDSLAARFAVGVTFTAGVEAQWLIISVDGFGIEAIAFESISDHGGSTTTAAPLEEAATTTALGPEVSTTFGAEVWIDPNNAVLRTPGGRWGDADVTEASGPTAEPSHWPFTSESADPICWRIGELLDAQALGTARATARDEERGHDLDHSVIDVGSVASAVSQAFRAFPEQCPDVTDTNGDVFTVGVIDMDNANAFSLTSPNGEAAWLAVDYRNNLVSILAVQETTEDKLTDADMEDFERLVRLAFDELANG